MTLTLIIANLIALATYGTVVFRAIRREKPAGRFFATLFWPVPAGIIAYLRIGEDLEIFLAATFAGLLLASTMLLRRPDLLTQESQDETSRSAPGLGQYVTVAVLFIGFAIAMAYLW